MSQTQQENKFKRILKKPYVWGGLLLALLLLIDLGTKVAAQNYFSRADAPQKVDVIPGWISFCLTYNRGIAYGMGDTAPTWAKLAVIFGTAALMVGCAVLFCKLGQERLLVKIALVLIVAGGIGNCIDRVYYRVWDAATYPYGVRDMVDLSRFGFAVCNFADFFISGGAVLLVLTFLFLDKDAVFPVGKYKALAKAENKDEAPNDEEENG